MKRKAGNSTAGGIDLGAREELLRLLAEGQSRRAAAQQVGIEPEALRWAEIINPGWEQAMRRAEAEADSKVEQALFEAATSGNVPAAKLYLEVRRGRNWRK